MEGGVAVGPTEWSFNSASVTATQANGNNPYYRDNVPSPLIIPLFVTGNDGTYECGSNGTSYDSITLTLPGTCLYNYCNMHINYDTFMTVTMFNIRASNNVDNKIISKH